MLRSVLQASRLGLSSSTSRLSSAPRSGLSRLHASGKAKILLTQDVPNVGYRGEEVSVSKGYARNFLIPTKKAVLSVSDRNSRVKLDSAQIQKIQEAKLRAAAKKMFGRRPLVFKRHVRIENASNPARAAVLGPQVAVIPEHVLSEFGRKFNLYLERSSIRFPPELANGIDTYGDFKVFVKMPGDETETEVPIKVVKR
eukprot:TRINITY_DN4249_c0_g1_i3.p1 TRINITY_DN4249_c0_g1~~TRINITY_DN4249_c0_g1_i3.p1  ORF type:complete len:198 (-),score=48.96 TRINITY_DN4249_c0_g1_i3:159-752(-)